MTYRHIHATRLPITKNDDITESTPLPQPVSNNNATTDYEPPLQPATKDEAAIKSTPPSYSIFKYISRF